MGMVSRWQEKQASRSCRMKSRMWCVSRTLKQLQLSSHQHSLAIISCLSSHPPIMEANVNRMMDKITKLQPNKHYAVIQADGIESLTAGTHCPQAVWEMHQSLKACMSDHRHVDDNMASMHHLHSKQCNLRTDGNAASIYSPGTFQQMNSYTASSAYSSGQWGFQSVSMTWAMLRVIIKMKTSSMSLDLIIHIASSARHDFVVIH